MCRYLGLERVSLQDFALASVYQGRSNHRKGTMKRNAILLLVVLASVTTLIAADAPSTSPSPAAAVTEQQKPGLPKFDLDFPGGSPGDLVKAIAKASGHPLNAIISKKDEDVVLPPLKLRHTDVSQLFAALTAMSTRTISYPNGQVSSTSAYSFRCDTPMEPDAVWYFRSALEPRPPGVAEDQKPGLPKFDLDFPGGSPGDLVKAITKASGHPLNAIIPKEDEDVMLPPMKLRDTDVAQLFKALSDASHRSVLRRTGLNSYTYDNIGYSFHCDRAMEPDAVWYFHSDGPLAPPAEKVCRFYQLNPYLTEHSVESITTAIETGWKMLGETSPPTLSFHKDTGLLIAVGDPGDLKVIDEVLSSLERPKMPPPPVQSLAPAPRTPDGQ
jgi:uncharacterized protein (DUF427 family)